MTSRVPKNYKPTQKERFMSAKMKEYFRLKLIDWKNELLKESSQTLTNMQKEENTAKPDITDRASEEIDLPSVVLVCGVFSVLFVKLGVFV